MSDLKKRLGNPGALAPARAVIHKAVQLLTAAARANLKPEPDDSHSNLEWSPEKQAFLSHPLPVAEGSCQVGLSPATMMLIFICSDGRSRQLALAGRSYSEAMAWLDDQLGDEGIAAASQADIPYTLPEDVAKIKVFPAGSGLNIESLVAWYSLADSAIQPFVRGFGDGVPGASPIRCWPHHFDIATYVTLEVGNPETARGIGVGLSPGDESYDQPYFYVNPWPHLDAENLPTPVVPGHWHTTGFVGAIATGDEILTLAEIAAGATTFVQGAIEVGRAALSAK